MRVASDPADMVRFSPSTVPDNNRQSTLSPTSPQKCLLGSVVNLHITRGGVAENSRRFSLKNSRITRGIHVVGQVGNGLSLEPVLNMLKIVSLL